MKLVMKLSNKGKFYHEFCCGEEMFLSDNFFLLPTHHNFTGHLIELYMDGTVYQTTIEGQLFFYGININHQNIMIRILCDEV